MNCRICARPSVPLGNGLVLDKYTVQYYQCPHCRFIQTEEPYWLDEAYASPINISDIGLVGRNVGWAKIVPAIVGALFNANSRFLDYGGGYGLFVRLMRDAGLDFYLYDKHCENLFAREFEVEAQPADSFELVTAFEVFEHLVEPRAELRRMLDYARNILFTTVLVPDRTPALTDWWYYGLEHGQHVALYSRTALAALAQEFGLHLASDGRQLHLFTEKPVHNTVFRLVSRYHLAVLLARLRRRPSLLAQDYQKLTGKRLRA